MTESTGAPSQGPELSPVARLIGVFTSPTKTFESIARRPGWDWLLPVFLLMIAFFVVQSVTVTKIDVDQAVKNQMKFVEKMSKGNMTDAQRDQVEQKTREGFENGKKPVRRALTSLFVLIPIFFVPLLYHGLAAAFGAKTNYLKVVAGYAYTQTIGLIPLLLTTIVAYPKASFDPPDVQFGRILKSNVAAFMDFETTNKALLGLLSSVDVFDIWLFLVGSIALSKTTRLSKSSARNVVLGVWVAYIVVKVCLGLLLSAFMG
ncbi:MAG TPA: Yip1 family protein [Candidatus Polarisedimenticolaceae bacterium]|nr:Yip1 family protein [Candidatus Polarisedimenticolaceae bacterium]